MDGPTHHGHYTRRGWCALATHAHGSRAQDPQDQLTSPPQLPLTDESARTTTKFLPIIVGEHCTGDAIKRRDAVRNMESHSSSCSGRPKSTRLQKNLPIFLTSTPSKSSHSFHVEPKGSVAIFCQREPSPYCFPTRNVTISSHKEPSPYFNSQQQASVDVTLSSNHSDSHSHTTVTTHRRKA